MKNWKTNIIDLGDIQVGKRQTVIFQSLRPLTIILIKGKCGCITGKYNQKTNKLTVTYIPTPIPIHLRSIGEYKASKSIELTYYDGRTEVLTVKANVKNTLE